MIPLAALVTGGGKRLGRAIALALAEAGYAVAIHYNDSTIDAAVTATDVAAFGVKSIVLKADLSDEDAVSALVPAATAALAQLACWSTTPAPSNAMNGAMPAAKAGIAISSRICARLSC